MNFVFSLQFLVCRSSSFSCISIVFFSLFQAASVGDSDAVKNLLEKVIFIFAAFLIPMADTVCFYHLAQRCIP